MKSLSQLIDIYFPQEKILQKNKVVLKDKWVGRSGKIPLTFSRHWYIKQIDFVQTDKKYYFDRRQAFAFFSKLSIIIAPLFFLLFAYALSLILFRTPPPINVIFPVIIIGLIAGIVAYLGAQSIANILVIDTRWVTKKHSKGSKTTLEGKISSEKAYSHYFIYFLTDKQMKNTSLIDKVQSGWIFGKKLSNTMKTGITNAQFELKYRNAQ